MTCQGCIARDGELAYLRRQNAELVDKIVAMANPVALAVSRGQMIAPTQVATPLGTADGVDENGQAYIVIDGRKVPQEEYNSAMDHLARQMSMG